MRANKDNVSDVERCAQVVELVRSEMVIWDDSENGGRSERVPAGTAAMESGDTKVRGCVSAN